MELYNLLNSWNKQMKTFYLNHFFWFVLFWFLHLLLGFSRDPFQTCYMNPPPKWFRYNNNLLLFFLISTQKPATFTYKCTWTKHIHHVKWIAKWLKNFQLRVFISVSICKFVFDVIIESKQSSNSRWTVFNAVPIEIV